MALTPPDSLAFCGVLLLQQAGMAGNALPLTHIEHPCVGESSDVVEGLTLIGSLSVICASDDGRVAEEIHFDILNVRQRRLELRIADIGQELPLVAYFAVIFGIYKTAGNKGVERGSVAMDLGFVPHALQHDELALTWIR